MVYEEPDAINVMEFGKAFDSNPTLTVLASQCPESKMLIKKRNESFILLCVPEIL